MATIIVCDGGCGAQSPDPKSGLHVANKWFEVLAGYPRAGDRLDRHEKKQFCENCAPRVRDALKPEPS